VTNYNALMVTFSFSKFEIEESEQFSTRDVQETSSLSLLTVH